MACDPASMATAFSRWNFRCIWVKRQRRQFLRKPLPHGFFCLYFGMPQIHKPRSFHGIFVACGSQTNKNSAWHAIPSKPLARWLVFLCISIVLCIEFSLQTGSPAKRTHKPALQAIYKQTLCDAACLASISIRIKLIKRTFHQIFVANGSEGLKGKGIASAFHANSS